MKGTLIAVVRVTRGWLESGSTWLFRLLKHTLDRRMTWLTFSFPALNTFAKSPQKSSEFL